MLAQGLGVFSLVLGTAQLLAPHRVARPLGLAGRERLVAAHGLREIATGTAILATRRPAIWLWGRAAGDVLDLATLGLGLAHPNPRRRQGAGLGMLAVLGVGLLDILGAMALARERRGRRRARGRLFDYGDRRGLPRPVEAMRGAARRDFETPRDYAIPPPLRPWHGGRPVPEATSPASPAHP
jgi:hypothetical protein